MDKHLKKVYVTKYALTSGPFSVEAEIMFDGSMASWRVEGFNHSAHGKDFWLNQEDALADCERRRTEKLVSIEKQTKKLKAMTFEIKEG
ncbi:hypothetical protein [Serratia proteamaculans]|uniref:hypothetical protein n=1 Tax=Serratia proteamaculans TaxID=28151 RepID=UPI00217A97AC|nr:hypothetical protein [Serratia proteamaculans]CAI1181114.1 Uncharacterised protein [Serratia proteamaculans]